MTGLLSMFVLPGIEGALAQYAALAAVLAVGWSLHVWRLRAQHRDLMRLVDRQTTDWRREADVLSRLASEVEAEPGGDEPYGADPDNSELSATTVLAVASEPVRAALASRLAAVGVRRVAAADSGWSARVACRDALDDGRPYRLVLVDASLTELEEPARSRRLGEELRALGARVAFVRAAASSAGESAPVR